MQTFHQALHQVENDCPLGYWCTAGKVIPCGEGYYSNSTGQSKRSACKPCPQFATSRSATTSELDCVCIIGYYDSRRTLDVPADCRICTAGTAAPVAAR